MKTALRIAWRYLFAKKKQNAINIVSAVSAAGVCVVTAAIICILSVMNGFSALVEDLFSQFDPELLIQRKEGASFHTSDSVFAQMLTLPEIEVYSETVVQKALIQTNDKQMPVIVKGCDDNFSELTQIDSLMTEGGFQLRQIIEDTLMHSSLSFERCVPGIGLATQLNVGSSHISAIQLYAPRRNGRINMLRPEESFVRETVFTTGVFAVNQTKYDDNYLLVSLPLARSLFQFQEDEVTAVELKLIDGSNIRRVRKQLQQLLGEEYVVKDRYEQQADFFKIMQIEKLLTALLLIFILLIAAFNIVGSLSMLMIDKQEDCKVLRTLGADNRMIKRIFLYEGWLISLLGAGIGLLIGISLCLLQQHFGLLKLGNGAEYIISSYPVRVEAIDLLLTAIAVSIIGWIAAAIPNMKNSYQ